MNTKQLIQTVIIVAAFAGAGLVLYKGGLFGGGTQSALVSTATQAQQTQETILPYGDTLDFSKVIDPSRFNYGVIQYPQLDAQNDVGIPVSSLIAPIPATK